MTGANFASYVRKLTKTNSTTLTDADIALYANVEKDDLAEMIAEDVAEDFFMISIKRDLEDSKREYTLPSYILLHIKRVSALLDRSNWKLLNERDLNLIRLPMITESNITTAYNGHAPEYDLMDVGIKILSEDAIEDVTDGLQIEAMIYPNDIDATALAASTDLSVPGSTTTTAMPRASHKVWALRTSIAYKQSRPKPIPLNKWEKQIEIFEAKMIQKLRGRNLDLSYVPNIESDDGSDY